MYKIFSFIFFIFLWQLFSLINFHKLFFMPSCIVNCQDWQFTVARKQKNLPLAPPMLGTKLEFEVVKYLKNYFTTTNGDACRYITI